jgi:hypothetical protein
MTAKEKDVGSVVKKVAAASAEQKDPFFYCIHY